MGPRRATTAVLALAVVTGAASCGSRVGDRLHHATTAASTIPGSTTAPTTSTAPATTGSPTTSSPPVTSGATTSAAPTSAAPTTTVFDEAAARAAITAAWETFFRKTSTAEQRMALLENGPAMADALALAMQNQFLSQASATVKSITFESPQRADVVYDVALDGTVALADAQGVAVFVDGAWKVSVETFCGLASLAVGGPVPGCS